MTSVAASAEGCTCLIMDCPTLCCHVLPVLPADELETDDHYHLPTAYDDTEKGRSQKYEVLTQRYR